MSVIIGSARIDERGKASGGKAGDQTGAEVSTQNFYMHSKGWIGWRAKDASIAEKIAQKMLAACNNNKIGYSQSDRYGVIKHGINTSVATNCDCSSLVRECIKEATGRDLGDFNTASESAVLNNSGLFNKVTVSSSNDVCTGDILVTKTKGHTVVVTSGKSRVSTSASNNKSNDEIANEVITGKWGSGQERKDRLTRAGYNAATIQQIVNNKLKGNSTSSVSYYPRYTGGSGSLVDSLKSVGVDPSYSNRKAIANRNGISNYSGQASQNTKLLSLLKEGKLVK